MLRYLIAAWARPHILPEDARERLTAPGSLLCYVIQMHGIADNVVIQKACEKIGAPRGGKALAAAGVSGFPLLSLEKRTGFLGNRIDRRIPVPLRQLVRAAHANPGLEIALAPKTR